MGFGSALNGHLSMDLSSPTSGHAPVRIERSDSQAIRVFMRRENKRTFNVGS